MERATSNTFDRLSATLFSERAAVADRLKALKQIAKQTNAAAADAVGRACFSEKTDVRRAAEREVGRLLHRIHAALASEDPQARADGSAALAALAAGLTAPVRHRAEADPDATVRHLATDALAEIRDALHVEPYEEPAHTPGAEVREDRPLTREELEGPWSVLRSERDEEANKAIAQIVSDTLSLPEVDALRGLTVAPGFVARALVKEAADTIVAKAARHGVRLMAVPDARLVALPELARASAYRITEAGIDCEVVFREVEERMLLAWNWIALVVCGKLAVAKVRPVRVDVRRLWRTVQDEKLVTETEEHVVADVFCLNPPRRVRFGGELPDVSFVAGLGAPPEPIDVVQFAAGILKRKAGVKANPALSLAGVPHAPEWERFSFDSKSEFDVYCHWLLQVVRGRRAGELVVV